MKDENIYSVGFKHVNKAYLHEEILSDLEYGLLWIAAAKFPSHSPEEADA